MTHRCLFILKTTAKCYCKENVLGDKCDKCKIGFYNLSASNPFGCKKCDCYRPATIINPATNETECNQVNGVCFCRSKFVIGQRCDTCADGTYDLDNGCDKRCTCDPYGSVGPACEQMTGQCICKPNIGGIQCNLCAPGFYNLTSFGCLNKCDCNPMNSLNTSFCNTTTGQCLCKPGYGGRDCGTCDRGYWQSNGMCKRCSCNPYGVSNQSQICEIVSLFCLLSSYLLYLKIKELKPHI